MYKIFINEKPFIITSVDLTDDSFARCKREPYETTVIMNRIRECEGMQSKGLVLLTDDVEGAYKEFYSHFVPVEAAGGVVLNTSGELLVIKRMGKCDLPKGKIDAGETIEEAALREVEEECGINGLALQDPLETTYHTYKLHNHRFLKITYWFRMTTRFNGKLIPQLEEQITEAKWIRLEETLQPSFDTYNSIRQLLQSIKGN